MTTIWRLNGEVIPEPSTLKVADLKLTRTERTASGRRVTDVIAFKLRVEMSFDTMTAAEMLVFSNAYHAVGSFAFTFPYLGSSKTINVQVADDFQHEMLYASPESWKGITIALEEE